MAAEMRQNIEKRQQDERLRLLNPVALPKAPKSPDRFAIGALGMLFSLAASLRYRSHCFSPTLRSKTLKRWGSNTGYRWQPQYQSSTRTGSSEEQRFKHWY